MTASKEAAYKMYEDCKQAWDRDQFEVTASKGVAEPDRETLAGFVDETEGADYGEAEVEFVKLCSMHGTGAGAYYSEQD